MAASKSAKSAKQSQKAEMVTFENEEGSTRTVTSAVWNNLPKSQKEKFKITTPAEVKKQASDKSEQ